MSRKKKTVTLIIIFSVVAAMIIAASVFIFVKLVNYKSPSYEFEKKAEPMNGTSEFPYFGCDESRIDKEKSNYGNTVYTVKDATGDEYLSYVSMLDSKGFDLLFTNEIKGNIYHGFACEGDLLYTYFVPSRNEIMIIDDNATDITALEEGLKKTFLKRSDIKLAMLDENYAYGSFGMCYIFTLENGEFVIIDGGYDEGSEEIGYDYERIYQYLKYFNPLKFKKPQIAAWILTHEHPDHYNSIHTFAQNHGSDVNVKTFLINCVPGPYSGMFLREDLESFGSETKLIIPHSGQIFDYYGLRFEYLFTYEDYLKQAKTDTEINNYSTIFKVTANGQTILFPADASEGADSVLCPMYGDYLKSDIVQIAHHGYNLSAGTEEFYDLVDPEVVLWPHSDGCFNGWRYSDVNVHLIWHENVKQIIVADSTVKILTLPYDCSKDKPEEYVIKTDGSKPEKAKTEGNYIYDPKNLW